MPSNKSLSSSLPSNPNPRSSEISNPMRRSFTGNPFSKPSVIANPRTNFPNTPVNSPSDFPRRSSVGVRESTGSLRDFMDDKENGKDQILKPAKVRSPAASSKSTKNFMSPTISASCKITESPRKKILVERNEPAPTSTPSAEPKTHVRKVTFAEPLQEKKLDASLDEIPNFEEIPRSSLSSEDLGGETLHDANVPLIPNNDNDLSLETVHDVNVNVTLIPENDIHTESLFETVGQEADCVNLDPTFKLSPQATTPVSSTATILAPLDADPLMPPYDPKTNYLSPRPQFLHYRPKSRMELCNERELEDSFISGSFSDTEVTEDTQSEGSQKESEDVSSDEIVKQEEDRISEPSPATAVKPEEAVEAKEVPKPRFSVRAKAIALILLLSVAFVSISVTSSPVIDHSVFENFYEVYESSEFSEFARANFDRFSQFAKANFDVLARDLHIWFTKSLASFSELISNVGGAHNLAKLQYFNLTPLHDYTEINQYPIFGPGENTIGDNHPPVVEESDAASVIGTDDHMEDISAEHYEVYEEQLQQDMGGVENASDAPESEEVHKDQPAIIIESEQALQLAEEENLEVKLAQEVDAIFNVENASDAPEEVLNGQSATIIEPEQALQLAEAGNSEENQTPEDGDNFIVENQLSLDSAATEIHIEVGGAGNVDSMQAQEYDAKLNVGETGDVDLKHWSGSDSEVDEIRTAVDDEVEGKSGSLDAAVKGNEQRLEAMDIPPVMVLYVLLCAGTVVIAGAAFNWSRKGRGKSRSEKITSSEGKELHTNRDKPSQISPDKPSLRNGPIEMDVVGESCPSEMSSFEKSTSYSRRVEKQLNEVQSIEKKRKNVQRRESLASSSDFSMGSPSYGSLTVYEKIPSKPGHGDDEIVTPVRRSSRIRNLATSPL
ncbi:hypothetical protein SESBI_09852 [Sesbania bispinosa]|nr:hypothetical protein SESBI_09852 [Sesbania bispinosa]